jgi:hypothetical protein
MGKGPVNTSISSDSAGTLRASLSLGGYKAMPDAGACKGIAEIS